MGLHEDLDARLKEAMKAKDERTLDVIRMIRSKAKKAATVEGKSLDDALYLDTIQSYVKQMKRAIAEYENAGDSGADMAAKLRFEVEYLEPFLPSLMNEDEVRGLVKEVVDGQGITDARQAGRVVGMVMKNHKGRVDPSMVKRIATEILS